MLFGRVLLLDSEPGFINRVSTEYAARRAFGLQQAFRHCKKKEDWCKPRNAKEWSTMVDWNLMQRRAPSFSAEFNSAAVSVVRRLTTLDSSESCLDSKKLSPSHHFHNKNPKLGASVHTV